MKKYPIFLILILFSVFISSCKYDFILPEVVVPVSDVSFSEDVVPIFSSKCTGCHKTGGQAPDLTAANAYDQIMTKYVNKVVPEESLIYSYPAPTTSTHTRKKYTAGEADLILQWIEEGAEKN